MTPHQRNRRVPIRFRVKMRRFLTLWWGNLLKKCTTSGKFLLEVRFHLDDGRSMFSFTMRSYTSGRSRSSAWITRSDEAPLPSGQVRAVTHRVGRRSLRSPLSANPVWMARARSANSATARICASWSVGGSLALSGSRSAATGALHCLDRREVGQRFLMANINQLRVGVEVEHAEPAYLWLD